MDLPLHHAYLIEGERESLLEKVKHFLEEKWGILTRGNPDFWHAEFDTFGIDDARLVQEMHVRKTFSEQGKKIFVISTNFITHEAQNSLLKIFEEPTANTHFFVLTQSVEAFLPTLKSRMVIVARGGDEGLNHAKLAKDFLVANPAKRLKLLAEIIEEKDKAQAISFLNSLEAVLYKNVDMSKMSGEQASAFEEIIKCRSFLGDRAPAVKMLLEHLSLIIPVIK